MNGYNFICNGLYKVDRKRFNKKSVSLHKRVNIQKAGSAGLRVQKYGNNAEFLCGRVTQHTRMVYYIKPRIMLEHSENIFLSIHLSWTRSITGAAEETTHSANVF